MKNTHTCGNEKEKPKLHSLTKKKKLNLSTN